MNMKLTDLFAGDIWDVLSRVLHYNLFEINQKPISVLSLFMFILMLIAFFIMSKIGNRVILRRILIRFDIERGIRFNLLRISHYLIMTTGTVIAFQFVGIDLGGLAVVFGLLSVGIGFGLQNITSNFISGLILLFERPIKVGDRVTVGSVEGDVVAINIRSTTVRTLNNIAIIVPNTDFVSSQVTNLSYGDPTIRLVIDVGVSYDSDIDLVIKALKEVADEHSEILKEPAPDVLLREFGDSSWNMQLRAWLGSPSRHYSVASELKIAIVRKFREYNIEIPFPQRDLHVRSPLPVPFKQAVEAN
jgi:small-conductance mechanosensitive channel